MRQIYRDRDGRNQPRHGSFEPSQPQEGGFEYTDPLTGIANRRRFYEKIESRIEQVWDDPVPFAVCLVDLDGFKPINDYFGRSGGDEILCQVALRLKTCVPHGAIPARIEGDRFAIFYPNLYTERACKETGDLLVEIISAPFDLGERSARLTASVGISLFTETSENADVLVQKAESATYESKKSGRGLCTVYSAKMEEKARYNMQVEQALRLAIADDAVTPFYQPIVDLPTGKTIGFEALARWTDRSLGFVSPGVFIPIAEERGMITQLTQALLKKAAKQARLWPDDVFLSFNLSPAQLIDMNTVNTIVNILSKAILDPRRLEIEITETSMMANPEAAMQIINDLRAIGIRISLDDFGTGQSSLGRLREFQFDKVKIDRAFVSTMLEDRPTEHIVRAILSMCEGMEMKVVAEGIEEKGQANMLIDYGCGGGQGYLYGKALDAQTAIEALQTNYTQMNAMSA